MKPKGGYGIVFIHVDKLGNKLVVDEITPLGSIGTTNNRMELQACVDALKLSSSQTCYSEISKIVIRTDSRYVKDNVPNALGKWRVNAWENRHGRPIDSDLWKDLAREYKKIHKRIDFQWVKGHGQGKQKDQHNYRADSLASDSALNPLNPRKYRSSVRRKYGNKKTIRGSINVHGQIEKIYIIEGEWMNNQKLWKYRYQIASKESSDFQNIDFIYSTETIRDGHFYEVQLNNNLNFPQIVGVIQELDKANMDSIMRTVK